MKGQWKENEFSEPDLGAGVVMMKKYDFEAILKGPLKKNGNHQVKIGMKDMNWRKWKEHERKMKGTWKKHKRIVVREAKTWKTIRAKKTIAPLLVD